MSTGLPNLGRHGGGWVALQFLLLGILALVGVRGWGGWGVTFPGVVGTIGMLVMSAGTIVAVFAVLGLGSSLRAAPAPLEGAALRTDGMYGVVRHPIYFGLILIATGFSLATTPWALLVTAALAVVLDLKRRVEERFLEATHPQYAVYRAAVPNALIPYVW
jgi:protein-S-isoprenylcysteine O-methyltransferase Ste14